MSTLLAFYVLPNNQFPFFFFFHFMIHTLSKFSIAPFPLLSTRTFHDMFNVSSFCQVPLSSGVQSSHNLVSAFFSIPFTAEFFHMCTLLREWQKIDQTGLSLGSGRNTINLTCWEIRIVPHGWASFVSRSPCRPWQREYYLRRYMVPVESYTKNG